MTHSVSLAATDAYWRLALEWMDKLFEAKRREGIKKKIPQFLNQRNNMFHKTCPRISMDFAYRHIETNEVVLVKDVDKAPTKTYASDPNYVKLYESASVKVTLICIMQSIIITIVSPISLLQYKI